MSAREFATYRLHAQKDSSTIGGSNMFRLARVTEKYIVDCEWTIQSQRLSFDYDNQENNRSHIFRVLRDALNLDDVNIANIDKGIILPSSFTGVSQHMHQLYQDAMAIVRTKGKPNYFLTMTCNLRWIEIQKKLLIGQTWNMRPNLVARVFQLKVKAFFDLIMNKHLLGKVVAKIHTIEFKKRGLPHIHCLLIMADKDKPKSTIDYDRVISAKIPNSTTHPWLFKTIVGSMMHRLCGLDNPQNSCIENNKCAKKFPKAFASTTTENEDGYPSYQRYNAYF
jgi:hypothetical protein